MISSEDEKRIIREVLVEGRQMLAQGLFNLLMERQEAELRAFRARLEWLAFLRWRRITQET